MSRSDIADARRVPEESKHIDPCYILYEDEVPRLLAVAEDLQCRVGAEGRRKLADHASVRRIGVLARTVRDDGSAADTVQAVTAVVSEAFDALKADRQPTA